MTRRTLLASTEVTVAEYVADLVRARLAMATIRRRLAAIAFAFDLTGRPTPTQSALVSRAVAGAARTLGTSQDRAASLRLDARPADRRSTPAWPADARPAWHQGIDAISVSEALELADAIRRRAARQ